MEDYFLSFYFHFYLNFFGFILIEGIKDYFYPFIFIFILIFLGLF